MADTTDIGGSFSQVGGPSQIVPSGSVTSTNAPKKTGYSNKDSISAADLAASLVMMWTINAENPVLSAPVDRKVGSTGSIDGFSAVMNLSNKYHEICMEILDSWSASIKKVDEEAKQAEKSPANRAKIEVERSRRLGLVESVKSYADQLKLDKNDSMLGSVTSALVITGAFIGAAAGAVVDVASTTLVGVTPQINFAVDFTTRGLSAIGDDFRAQLGLIGAWAMGTLINNSTLETVAGKGDKPINEKMLAEKYASKILKLLNSDQLNNFIMAMLINKTEKGQPLSENRKIQLSSALKTILLASALAAIYKSLTGRITAQEFLGLISRDPADPNKMKPQDGLEAQLVASIHVQLDAMDPVDRAKLLDALATYMDTDRQLTAFFDVGKVFDSINETLTASPDTFKT